MASALLISLYRRLAPSPKRCPRKNAPAIPWEHLLGNQCGHGWKQRMPPKPKVSAPAAVASPSLAWIKVSLTSKQGLPCMAALMAVGCQCTPSKQVSSKQGHATACMTGLTATPPASQCTTQDDNARHRLCLPRGHHRPGGASPRRPSLQLQFCLPCRPICSPHWQQLYWSGLQARCPLTVPAGP